MTKVAIVMLACRDYEAMELALACHTAYAAPDVPFFILQNCRGSYDAERTFAVARRYADLFPATVRVIDDIPPGDSYGSIATLLASRHLKGFDLVCKVDDDAFPIAPGWLEALVRTCEVAAAESGERLGYVTPLINNNVWGFRQVLQAMGLEQEYFQTQARVHLAGNGESDRRRVRQADEIVTGHDGTLWGYPYLARWLHQRTSAEPDALIRATANLSPVDVPADERYSIGCILFRPALWQQMGDDSRDDEGMLHRHCAAHGLRIVCARAVPFVHLVYFTHREENRDVVETLRAVYEPRLGHPFPIAVRKTHLLELEGRLRWMESAIDTRLDEIEARFRRLAAASDERIARIDAQLLEVGRHIATLAGIVHRLDRQAAAAKARRQKTVRRRLKRAWRRLMQAPTAP
jgi:hypothetical protein